MKFASLPSLLRRSRSRLTGFVCCFLAGLATSFALTPSASAKPKRAPFKPPYLKIDSVNATAHTISVSYVNSKDTSVKTYMASPNCEIEVNGAKATFDAIHAGQKVSVSEGSSGVATRIVASPAPQ